MRPSRNARRALAVAIAVALAPALSPPPARADAVTVRDAGGRMVTIADAGRIVSIGGAITEILYALGLERRIVAVDSTSTFPAEALARKPNVGYMRQLSPEGILGLAPSLVLAADGSGPPQTIAVLEQAQVPLVRVPDRFDGEGILDKIRLVARATGRGAAGECLVRAAARDLDALGGLRAAVTRPLRVAFLLSLVNGRPTLAGRGTAADGIIRLAGAINAIDAFEGYKLVNDEALIAARPDAVLAMARASHPLEAETVLAHPAFAASPAPERRAFIAMDGLYLLGFGPRTARAARDLAAALYPTLPGAPLPSESETPACR